MKTYILIIILLSFWFSPEAQAQTTTLSLPVMTATPGENITVPLTVTNFNNIGAISLVINFDEVSLSYVTTQNTASSINLVANATSGSLSLAWFDASGSNPLNVGDGTLAELVFKYTGGTSDLLFDTAQSEIADATGEVISVTFENGHIRPAEGVTTVSLPVLEVPAGTQVRVPVLVSSFNDVGAISLKINFDQSILSFVNLENAPEGVNFTVNAAGGILSLAWFDVTGTTPLTLADTTLVEILFDFSAGSSDLNFITEESEIASSSGDPIETTFVNGMIVEKTTSVESSPTKARTFFLEQNYPNPFNPETRIRYQVGETGRVILKIYNLFGQKIRTLVNDIHSAGKFQVVWNGRDDRDQKVPSGVYFYRLISGNFVQTRKLILIR